MIDRISRSFVNYSAYRREMTSQAAVNNSYEVRQNNSVLEANGKARLVSSYIYPRRALEYSLIHAMNNVDRIKDNYTYPAKGYVPSTVDSQGYPYIGQNIDIKV
ncbi:MAG: hypothetical protein LBH05_04890 [Deferribacteraceae bacterium]|nr:hypothetical protein [Deferribacteraceae bacterium]